MAGERKAKRERKPKFPDPTSDRPSESMLESMVLGLAEGEATDGCTPIEADGRCQHGYPAWPLYLGMM